MKTCSICRHPKIRSIDHCLLSGQQQTVVARRYGLSIDSVNRHSKHARSALARAQAARDAEEARYGSRLLRELEHVRSDVLRLQAEAESQRDIRGALLGIRQRLGICELEARLQGMLDSERSATTNILNLNVPESTLRRMAQMYLESHPALPDTQPESADSPNDVLTLSGGIVEKDANG